MGGALTRLDLRRKKVAPRLRADTPRVEAAGSAYREVMIRPDPARFKFVDEAGVSLAMMRLPGRAPRGERIRDSVLKNYGESVTLLGTMPASGVETLITVCGPDA